MLVVKARPIHIAITLASLGGLTATLAYSKAARAYDAEVDASTIAQAYQLRGLTGDPVLSRRRVTQTLQLGVYNITDTTKVSAPQVMFRARMRLDADFGISREEYSLSQTAAGRYVPLLQPAPVDLMYGYLEGKRFAGGILGFKIGRQYVIDPLGYYAFDGAQFKITTPAYFAVEAYGGWEVRGGLPLSSNPQIGRWEQPGVVRYDRSDYAANGLQGGYPSVQPQSLAPVWGASIETAGPTWIHGKLTYRRAYNTGASFVGSARLGPDQMAIYDRARIAHERLGYGANVTIGDIAGLRTNIIYDLYGKRFTNIEAGADFYVGKRVTASVDYSKWQPFFDSDSIFNVFGYEPMDDFQGRVEVDATNNLNIAVDGMVRLYHSDDVTEAQNPNNRGALKVASTAAPGGGLRFRYKWPTARLVFRSNVLTGDQGRRVGGDLAYDRSLGERWLVDGRLSLWNFKNSTYLRADTRETTSIGYVVGGGYRLTPESNAMLQWEHDINQLVGMRYRILAVLNVRVWL